MADQNKHRLFKRENYIILIHCVAYEEALVEENSMCTKWLSIKFLQEKRYTAYALNIALKPGLPIFCLIFPLELIIKRKENTQKERSSPRPFVKIDLHRGILSHRRDKTRARAGRDRLSFLLNHIFWLILLHTTLVVFAYVFAINNLYWSTHSSLSRVRCAANAHVLGLQL